MTMTEKYKVLGQYIKDSSSETPDIETYIFVKKNSNKDFIYCYLYNEIGRSRTSHKLYEKFFGKFSQVTEASRE